MGRRARSRGAMALAIFCAMPALLRAQSPTDPFPAPAPGDLEKRLTQSSVFVKRVRVEGAASLDARAIAAVVAPYENRVLTPGDVRALQQALTRLYVDEGFISSGVILADEAPLGEELVLRAVEGRVTQVRFATPLRWARPQYLTRLLVPDDNEPVRLGVLQERLASLRDAGVVDRIKAELVPLPRLGESELVVEVEEPRLWLARIDYDNHHSPTIGARRATLNLAHRNLTGWGDALEARYGDTEGLNDALVRYSLPIPFTRLRVGGRWDRSDSLAISPAPFRSLDIKALSTTAAFEVGYGVVQRASSDLSVFAAVERRRSATTLLGIPFSFVPGIADGVSRVDVTRAGASYSARGAASVLFARAQASAGRTNVDPDLASDGAPARSFRAYFAQAQYAHRLPFAGAQAVLRVEGQYTPDILMPVERYALGGASTVRGYRENLLLRDRGALASVEVQVPLTRADAPVQVHAAAFADAGWSRNTRSDADGLPRRLASAGVGFLAAGPWGLSGRIYVARPATRWLTPRDDLQDRGVHFVVSWEPTRLLP